MGEGMVDGEDEEGPEAGRASSKSSTAVVAVGPVVEVGEHDALGVARGARGVADGDRVVLLGLGGDGVEAGGEGRARRARGRRGPPRRPRRSR